MLITDKELKRVVNDNRNLSTGRVYYTKDYVKKINILPQKGDFLIEGVVNNNFYEDRCEILVSNDNKIIDYNCDCYWCDEDSACGHVAATLLKVQELSPDFFPFEYENKVEDEEDDFLKRLFKFQEKQEEIRLSSEMDLTRNLIDNFKESKKQEFAMISQEKKNIQVLIYADEYPFLKFKVGNDQMYMIRSIDSFLSAIDNHETIRYGKNLKFVHDQVAFSVEALTIIALMENYILERENHYMDIWYGLKNELEIHDFNVDRVYETLSNLQTTNRHLKLFEIEQLIKLRISDQTKYYTLELDDFNGVCGKNAIYLFDENTIMKINLDSRGKVVEFIKWCLKKEKLLLAKDDVEAFNKYIFNDIRKYFEIEGISLPNSEVNDEILTLYGDIDDNDLVKVFLESKQGNQTLYSFDHDNQSTSVNFELIEDYLTNMADHIDKNEHSAYFDLDKENTFTFLEQGLPFLTNYCQIMVSDALANIGRKTNYSITVGVSIENNLLEIDVDSIDIPKEELTNVLNSYHRKKKFHRLKNGQLLNLESDELAQLDKLMDDYHLSPKMLDDGQVTMDIYRAFSIDEQADNSTYLQFNRSETFKDVINNFRNIQNQTFTLSKHYQEILRDYQKFGYQWLQLLSSYGFGGVLADDMGLGKTLQVIALLDENRRPGTTSLVVCPSSLLLNWNDEVHKFSDVLTCQCVHGDLKKRKLAISQFGQVDLLITTYDYIRRDVQWYEDYEFEYVILDEAQYIKNPKTKNATAVKSLKAKHRFALTGTPIENSLAELWSIFDFLMPNYLFNYHYFQTTYETPIVKNKDEEKQAKLKKLVSPFILRRNKQDVLTELPEKIEKTLIIEFNQEEEKIYLANLMQVNKELQEKVQAEKVDRIMVLAMLTRLRQICCEPRLIYDNITSISSKLAGCLDLIRNFQGNNQKVLLFSSFTSMLDLISDELDKERISYYKLVGSTKKEQRHQLVEQFQNDDTTVFLISLKAGGTGLNLTAAEAVIHFDPWWNVSAQNQATDRAYRIGQENKVTVYKLVMKNSVEEKILQLQEMKKNLADSFVENNQGTITNMSTDEIIDLFKID